jgi:hypothetical protein
MNYHQALTATATGTITWYDAATAENIVTTQLKLVKEPKLIMHKLLMVLVLVQLELP